MTPVTDKPAKKKISPQQRLLMISVPAMLAVVGLLFFLFGDRHISTDDAYVKADKVAISSEVTGQVIEVRVTDNTRVKAGDTLFRIDPQPFQIALEGAQAKLESARVTLEGLQKDYHAKLEELGKADENVRYMQHEYERFRNLVNAKAAPAAQRDEAEHNRNNAIKERDTLKLQIAAELAKLNGNPELPLEQYPDVQQAQAALNKVKLDLSHTDVKAPIDGITGNVTLNPGEYAIAGAPLFTVINDRHMWVEANFKETEITHMHPGQDVDVKVDMYPGHKFKGVVDSITSATGSEFSILPAQNSSGNWVKVVQRIMVRVELKPEKDQPPLAAGMSTTTSVDTGATRLGRFFGAKDKGEIGVLARAPAQQSTPPQPPQEKVLGEAP